VTDATGSLERLALAPFAGREAVLAHLSAGAERALAGHPAWFVLVGEPGIGKTRTAEEALARARSRGFAVHGGRCSEADGAPAFRPWLQILRSIVRGQEGDAGAALAGELGAAALSDLAALVPELADPTATASVGGLTDRFRLFDAVASLLAAAARREPLAILVDDLHRADADSLALLAFCARELEHARVLVVATRRDTGEPATAAQDALARSVLEIPLAGLDAGELTVFFRALLGREPDARFVAAVRERTDGNPLFATELARLLALEGRLDAQDLAAVAASRLPVGLRELLGRRLDRLSPPCRRALACAAVLGREWSRGLFEAVLDAALLPQAGALLDEACRARITLPSDARADVFRFHHALVREALLDDLALDDRARLHARAGHALLALHPADATPVLAELAHHFEMAIGSEGPEPALRWSIEAARDAARRLAFEDAVTHYRRALARLADVPASLRERELRACELRIELASALDRAGHPAQARALHLEAAATARRSGAPRLLARAALGLAGERAGTSSHTPDAERAALLEEALAATDAGAPELRVPLLGRLASELQWSRGATRREALAQESIALARASGDPTLLAQALIGAIWATWGPDNTAWRRDTASEVIGVRLRARDPIPGMLAYIARASALLELGELAACDDDVDVAMQLAGELRYPFVQLFAGQLRVTRAILDGRLPEAERAAQANLALGRRIDSPHALSVHASHLTLIRLIQGRAGELAPTVGSFADRLDRPIVRASLAWVLLEAGRREAAQRELNRVLASDFEEQPRDWFWLATVASLAIVAAGVGDRDAAGRLYDWLLPYAERNVVVGMSAGCLGSAARYLGLLAAALGRFAEAERHFEASLAINARLRAFTFLFDAQSEYAALLRRRAAPGDAARAERLLEEATALRARLGLEHAAPAKELAAAASAAEGELAIDGRGWTVRFAAHEARVPDGRGMRYLAMLLERPEQELHVLDLLARVGGDAAETRAQDAPVIDERARAAYKERLRELRLEIDDAESRHDEGGAARARAELEQLEAALAAAFGLRGRARQLGDPAERARKAVYNRLRGAIARLETAHPALGRHLSRSVRTGTFCCYRPDPPVRWRVERALSR
jgi:hypothetical protein